MEFSSRERDHFWSRVAVKKPSDCWEWQRSRNSKGYGQVYVMGKNRLAHRVAWMLTYGEIGAGLCVCHKCDNPACCNPSHFFLGTQQQNTFDKVQKGRCSHQPGYNHPEGEMHPQHKLTAVQVREIRQRTQAGESNRSLAREYGVYFTTIGKIARCERWKNF